jgi:excisionase family DNA binding protein
MNDPGEAPLSPTLTYSQVSALVGRSVSTVERWVKGNLIPYHRVGRNVRFDPRELRDWLGEQDDETDGIAPARPLKKRPGAQYVFPKDTLGDDTHCWCGLNLGHDWTGKDRGAPHPHQHEGMQQVVVVEQQNEPEHVRIESKSDLRGYHAALKSFIVKCVNGDGLRWRSTKNAILLYPPDGTQPITVYCRNNDGQVRSLRQWYAAHVQPSIDVDEALVARLAEAVNDPAEHPVRESEPEPEWTPYIHTDGEPSEYFETNGTIVRCKLCVGKSTAYETTPTKVTGLGGHIRMTHRDRENLSTPEALAKSVDSRRYNRLHEQVTVAVELLAETIGFTPADTGKVAALEREVEGLRKELLAANQRANDATTKLQQLRDLIRGVE